MEPGLLAELSSSERATLRYVAFGIAETKLSTATVERLKALALVESKNQQLVLTELGKARFAALSSHQPFIDPNSVEFTVALSKALGFKNIE